MFWAQQICRRNALVSMPREMWGGGIRHRTARGEIQTKNLKPPWAVMSAGHATQNLRHQTPNHPKKPPSNHPLKPENCFLHTPAGTSRHSRVMCQRRLETAQKERFRYALGIERGCNLAIAATCIQCSSGPRAGSELAVISKSPPCAVSAKVEPLSLNAVCGET